MKFASTVQSRAVHERATFWTPDLEAFTFGPIESLGGPWERIIRHSDRVLPGSAGTTIFVVNADAACKHDRELIFWFYCENHSIRDTPPMAYTEATKV